MRKFNERQSTVPLNFEGHSQNTQTSWQLGQEASATPKQDEPPDRELHQNNEFVA